MEQQECADDLDTSYNILNIFVLSKVSKHESVEAKNISSKELDSICMTHFINVNLGITIHNESTVLSSWGTLQLQL